MFYAGRWQEAEHINVQELRTVVGLLRHLIRGRENWRRRVLLFVDSMVALGALGKGRSSSPALLRLCRQVTAITLATRMMPFCRYIPSELNPADGPSRGQGQAGVATATKAAHADRAPQQKPLGKLHPLLAALVAGGEKGGGHAGG